MTDSSKAKTVRINVIAQTSDARRELQRLQREVTNLHTITRQLSQPIKINADTSGLHRLNVEINNTYNNSVNLRGMLTTMFAGFVSTGAINVFRDFALAADSARLQGDLFDMTARRMGISMRDASEGAAALVRELGGTITTSKAQEALEGLIRQGFSVEQATEAIGRATASALKYRKDATTAVEALNDVAATGLSARLNAIGVAENTSTYFKQAARDAGVAVDQLTKAQKAAALLKLLRDATASEYEQKDDLLGGVQGNLSRLQAEAELTKQSLGQLFVGPVNQGTAFLVRLLQALRAIPQELQGVIVAFTAFSVVGVSLTALAPVFTAVLLPAIKTFALVVTEALWGTAASLLGFGTAAAVASVAIVPVIAIVAAAAAVVYTWTRAIEENTRQQDLNNVALAENYKGLQKLYGPDVAQRIRMVATLQGTMAVAQGMLNDALVAGDIDAIALNRRRIAALQERIEKERELGKVALEQRQNKTYFGFVDTAIQGSNDELEKSGDNLGDYERQVIKIRQTWEAVTRQIKEADAQFKATAAEDGTSYDPSIAQRRLNEAKDQQLKETQALEKTAGAELKISSDQIDREIERGRIDRMEEGLAKRAALREFELAKIDRWATEQKKKYNQLAGAQDIIDQQVASKRSDVLERSRQEQQRYIDDLIAASQKARSAAQVQLLPEGARRITGQAGLDEAEIRREAARRLDAVRGNAEATRAIEAEVADRVAAVWSKANEEIKKSTEERAKKARDLARSILDATQAARQESEGAELAALEARYRREQQLAEGNARALADLAARYEPALARARSAGSAAGERSEVTRLERERDDLLAAEEITQSQRLAVIATYGQRIVAAQRQAATERTQAVQDGERAVVEATRAAYGEQYQLNLGQIELWERQAQARAELADGTDGALDAQLLLSRQLVHLDRQRLVQIGSQVSQAAALGLGSRELADLAAERAEIEDRILSTARQSLVLQRDEASADAERARNVLGVALALENGLTSLLERRGEGGVERALAAQSRAQRETNTALADYLAQLPTLRALEAGTASALGVSTGARERAGQAVGALTERLAAEGQAVDRLRGQYDRLTQTVDGLRGYAGGVGAQGGDLELLTRAAQQADAQYTRVLATARAEAAAGKLSLDTLKQLEQARQAADSAQAARTAELNRRDRQRVEDLRYAIAGLPQGAQQAVSAAYEQQIMDLERTVQARERALDQRSRQRAAGETGLAGQALSQAEELQQQVSTLEAQLDAQEGRLANLAATIPQVGVDALSTISRELDVRSQEWAATISRNLTGAIASTLSRELTGVRVPGVQPQAQQVTVVNRFQIEASGRVSELTDPEALRLAERLVEVQTKNNKLK